MSAPSLHLVRSVEYLEILKKRRKPGHAPDPGRAAYSWIDCTSISIFSFRRRPRTFGRVFELGFSRSTYENRETRCTRAVGARQMSAAATAGSDPSAQHL